MWIPTLKTHYIQRDLTYYFSNQHYFVSFHDIKKKKSIVSSVVFFSYLNQKSEITAVISYVWLTSHERYFQ